MNCTQSIGNVMISQPMGGLSDQEIVETRDRAICEIRKMGGTVINTLFTEEWKKNQTRLDDFVVSPLWFLAKSLEAMSHCHAVYFCKGWKKARGCRIEHEAAVAYGLQIIYEEAEKRPVITVSSRSHNMQGWYEEKINSLKRELTALSDALHRPADAPKDATSSQEYTDWCLDGAFAYLDTLLNMSCEV